MLASKHVAAIILLLACDAAMAQTQPRTQPHTCGKAPVPGSDLQLAFVKCSMSNHNPKLAEEQVRSFRSRHPDSVDAALVEAEILMRTHRNEDAIQVLDPVLRLHPRSVAVLAFYAELCVKAGRTEEAERMLQQATEIAPGDAEAWKRLGDFYLAKRPKEALRCFQRATQLGPGDAVSMAGLATAYHESDEPAKARTTFERAMALNRKSPSAIVHNLYATYLADEQEYRQSVHEFDIALKEDTDFVDANFGRAKALVELHEWSAAAPDLARAVLIPRHELPALALLVRVYREMGQREKAKEYAEELAKASQERDNQRVAGNEIAGQMQTASTLMQQQKPQEAQLTYERLVSVHPEATQAHLELGRCYARMGKLVEAESEFRSVVSADGSSSITRQLLGQVLLQEQRIPAARAEFNAALQLDPLNADAGLGLAATYIVERRYDDAVRTLKETQRTAPARPELSLMLAEALFKDAHRNAAVREVNQLLKSDPQNRAAHQMLKAFGDH